MIKKIKTHIVLLFSILLVSCYGVNKETSEIFDLSVCCNDKKETWPLIFKEYATQKSNDQDVNEILKKFKNQIHETDVIYFKEYPQEYIGISENRMFVRYVYNRKISNEVLNGLSLKLSESEKLRIGLRVIGLQMNSLGEEGRKEAAIIIKTECQKIIESTE